MGNSTSQSQDANTNSAAYKSLSKIPAGTPSRTSRPASSSGPTTTSPTPTSPSAAPKSARYTHHSMKYKKKSLELPDLAPLALSSISGSAATSSPAETRTAPIEIPSKYSKPDTSGHHALKPKVNTQRPRTYLTESTQQMANREEPSTHIPIAPPQHFNEIESDKPERGRSRRENKHDRSRPSTSSRTRSPSPPRSRSRRPTAKKVIPQFQKETLKSALPTFTPGHGKKASVTNHGLYPNSSTVLLPDENDDPTVTSVQIVWKGGGSKVTVEHADESEWSTAMHHQELVPIAEDHEVWTTTLPLEPGMHHIRFLVDGVPRLTADLPTAVDDAGNLANFVSIEAPQELETYAELPQERPQPVRQGDSFWNSVSGSATSNHSGSDPDDSGSMPPRNRRPQGRWTQVIPAELEAAAREEEIYLAETARIENGDDLSDEGESEVELPDAPAVPPAPRLPRHLGTVNLNMRDFRAMDSSSSSSTRSRERDRRRASIGMSANVPASTGPQNTDAIPVSTASGTHLPLSQGLMLPTSPSPMPALPLTTNTAAIVVKSRDRHSPSGIQGGTNAADDSSVLPIPSHVVLHHLATSTVKNGVLAVANTTRYRDKFITAVYYAAT